MFKTSVDMVRLTSTVETFQLELFMSRFRNEPAVEYWSSSKFATYKHNFKCLADGGSFWFACEFNGVTYEKLKKEIVVEYNPNKLESAFILKVVLDFLFKFHVTPIVVKGCDVAFDFYNVPRDSIYFDKSRYRRVVEFIENGSRTTYIGKRGWGGIKIYDKAKEQKINNMDWTRIEFTVKLDLELRYFRGLSDIEQSMPFISSYDYMSCPDVKYKAYFHLIYSGLASVNDFGRRIKKELNEYAGSLSSTPLIAENNKNDIVNAIITYLETLVNNYPVLLDEIFPF